MVTDTFSCADISVNSFSVTSVSPACLIGVFISIFFLSIFMQMCIRDSKYRVPILLTPGKDGSCDSWQISWFTKAGKKAFYKMEFKSIAQ